MRIQQIQSSNSNQQNFKGVRVPSVAYSMFYPNEVVGVSGLIDSFAKQGKLSAKHADSLNSLLGNDDIHLEKTDDDFLEKVVEFNWMCAEDNYKALSEVINKATVLPKEAVDKVSKKIVEISQSSWNKIGELERELQSVKLKNKDDVEKLVGNLVEDIRKNSK